VNIDQLMYCVPVYQATVDTEAAQTTTEEVSGLRCLLRMSIHCHTTNTTQLSSRSWLVIVINYSQQRTHKLPTANTALGETSEVIHLTDDDVVTAAHTDLPVGDSMNSPRTLIICGIDKTFRQGVRQAV